MKEPSEIDFVAYFRKVVLHNANSFSTNIELLRRNNMESLAYMIAIIKG